MRTGALAVLLAAVSLAALSAGPPAVAQDSSRGTVSAYDIPPQPLPEALIQFGRQSGLQVSADSNVIRDMRTGGVSGTMGRDQALAALLAGTGLVYRINGSMVALERAAAMPGTGAMQLDPVQVQANIAPAQAEIGNLPPAYAGGQVASGSRIGLLGNLNYMNTPFSATSFTQKYIEEQQPKTIIDVIQDDPTVRSFFAPGAWNDEMVIRGFTAGITLFGGLQGVGSTFAVPMAGIERVEIFRGASAMLNGVTSSSAVGGVINLVPKRATDAPITRGIAQYSSSSQFGGQIDFGRRFGPDKEIGLRLNGYYTDGSTTTSFNNDQIWNFTAGLDYRGTDTRLDADFGWIQRNLNGPRAALFVTPGVGVPAPPSSYNNASQPWEFYNSSLLFGVLRFEHDFTPDVTGFLKVGGQHFNGNVLIAPPSIVDMQGNTSAFSVRGVLATDTLSAEAGMRANVRTGPVRHDLALNGTYLLTNNFAAFTGIAPVTSNIYAPVVQPTPDFFSAPTQGRPESQSLETSVGLIDNLFAFNDRVQIMGGARLQHIQVSNYDGTLGIVTPDTPGQDASALSPMVALVVRPVEWLSVYGNYIQALEPGQIAGAGLANAGETLPPFVSTQFEVGAKVDLGNFGATLSAFSITRPSASVDVTTNTLVVNGLQRNQGIEFTVFGEPLPGLRPLGGFSVLSPILIGTPDGTNNGKTAPGVPNFQANLGLDWSTPFVKGLSLSGRVVYTGQSYVDVANTQPVAPWTRVDLGASYTFERLGDGKPVTLRASVINVGNANYFMSNTTGTVTQSAARTFYVSLGAAF